jgi:hypothetical protein
MAGHGGFKHRKIAGNLAKSQHRKKAAANIARVRKQFESKGQAWAPAENPAQMAALNHDARRFLQAATHLHR